MDRQLQLNLATEAERVASVLEYLRPVQLASRQQAAVALIVGCGELIQVQGHAAVRWQAAKMEVGRKAKDLVGICANTFARAAAELEDRAPLEPRHVVGILRTTVPWTYAVSLATLAELPARIGPLEALAGLGIFGTAGGGEQDPPVPGGAPSAVKAGQARSSAVKAGQGRSIARVRDREEESLQNPCLTVYRDPCVDAGEIDRGWRDAQLEARCRRPWDRRAGLVDDDLVSAVRCGDLLPIRLLWREALMLEWIGGSEDDLCRFLTCVYHAAMSPGLTKSRMGNLVARVKRGCDVAKTLQECDQWAGLVMQALRDLPAIEVALAARGWRVEVKRPAVTVR